MPCGGRSPTWHHSFPPVRAVARCCWRTSLATPPSCGPSRKPTPPTWRPVGSCPRPIPYWRACVDGIVERMAPPFAISKLEGDAVFSFAADDELQLRGPSFLACLATCYEAYRARLKAARDLMTCTCDACSSIGGLDLKFVLHHGEYIIQSVAGHQELLGPRRHRGPPAHEEPRDRPHRAIGLRTPHRVSGRSPRSPTRARPPDR